MKMNGSDIDFERLEELVQLGEEWETLREELYDHTHDYNCVYIKELVVYAIYIKQVLGDLGLSESVIDAMSVAEYSDLKAAIKEVLGD